MKTCSKCKEIKPFSEFHKCKRAPDGAAYDCIACSKAYAAEYAAANRDRILSLKKATYERNKKSWDNYRSANAAEIAARKRKWYAEKVKADPAYRLKERIRKMVYRTLEYSGAKKQLSTLEQLGYNAEMLKSHLEKQFQKGMSWENYGKWHIDHIAPVSALVDSGVTDPRVINCLTNLRPMWASENISKGAKMETLL